MASSNSTFELHRVTVSFANTVALKNASLTIQPGELVAFVGPSGAGKTTLLRLLNGTGVPTSGDVKILGENTSSLKPRAWRHLRTRIGFVYQEHRLVPNLRVIQNVISGQLGERSLLTSLRMLWFPSRDVTHRVAEILDRVGIADKIYQRTDKLSGGEQQRVAIARTLFQHPSVILADEPISSVDPARARETLRLLCDVATEHEMALCVSLHQLDLAREFFPRLIGMRGGNILFDSAVQDVNDADFDELYRISGSREVPPS